ncbi:MAG: arsenate reductase (glutaredoxin) [Rubrivivax sp.]
MTAPAVFPSFPVTLLHNPACSTSRNALALLRERGFAPTVVEYLKTPLDAQALRALVDELGIGVRGLLRDKEPVYAELGLADPQWTDAQLLDVMARHPRLMNRPVVRTPLGARLGRPLERVLEVLPPA